MKNFADGINDNWDWLRGKLGDDWDAFLADSQKAINQFNINKNLGLFEKTLIESLEKTNKVSDFLRGCKMATNEAEPTKPEDLVQNSVDELAEKVRQEQTTPQGSQTN